MGAWGEGGGAFYRDSAGGRADVKGRGKGVVFDAMVVELVGVNACMMLKSICLR